MMPTARSTMRPMKKTSMVASRSMRFDNFNLEIWMQKSRVVLSFKKVLAQLPSSTDSVDPRVARLKSTEECRCFIFNALERQRPDLALQAFHRIPTFGGVFGRSRFDRKLMKELLIESGVEGGLDSAAPAASLSFNRGICREGGAKEAANPSRSAAGAADTYRAPTGWEIKSLVDLARFDAPVDSANDDAIRHVRSSLAAAA
jgi:hypothetical protein